MSAPLSHEQVQQVLDEHAAWRRSLGKSGREAFFEGVRIDGFRFDEQDLSGVVFKDSTLFRCSFVGTLLIRSRFTSCRAIECNFEEADLTKANFWQTQLMKSNFEEAFLASSEFNGADLSGASFKGADMGGAEFGGCDLEGVEVEGALDAYGLMDAVQQQGATVIGLADGIDPTPPTKNTLPGFLGVAIPTWERKPADLLRPEDYAAFQEVARDRDFIIVVREASLGLKSRAGVKGFRARPPEVPGTPRGESPGLGLVAAGPDVELPEGIQRDPDSGVLRDGDGNTFFEGYQLLGVFDAPEQTWEYEPGVLDQLNAKLGEPLVLVEPLQAAAFGDTWPPGLTPPSGGAVAFLPEGDPVRLEDVDTLEVFYKQNLLPWDRIYVWGTEDE